MDFLIPEGEAWDPFHEQQGTVCIAGSSSTHTLKHMMMMTMMIMMKMMRMIMMMMMMKMLKMIMMMMMKIMMMKNKRGLFALREAPTLSNT